MDSFYDAPRRPPQPLPKDTLTGTPVVPDISVLCPSNNNKNAFTPYNQWKTQQQTTQRNFLSTNKENILCQSPRNTSILKKQVRFESPPLQQARPISQPVNIQQNVKKIVVDNATSSNQPVTNFEKIYLANIPSRQLDLSVIDLGNKTPQKEDAHQQTTPKRDVDSSFIEKGPPKSYKEFREQKVEDRVVLNDSVTDIFNYKRSPTSNESPRPTQNITEMKKRTLDNNKLEFHTPFKQSSQKITEFQNYTHNLPQDNAPKDQAIKMNGKEQDLKVLDNRLFSNELKYLHGFNRDAKSVDVETQVSHNMDNKHSLSPSKFVSDKDGDFNKVNPPSPKIKHHCSCKGNVVNSCKNSQQNDDDFSVKDLLKIISQQSNQIAMQNEQILLLQRQVSELLCREKANIQQQNLCIQERKTENKCCNVHKEPDKLPINKCVTSTQHEKLEDNVPNDGLPPKRNKNGLPNFSIGLTTSFEVSFRRTAQNQDKYKDCFAPPKIQEITETETVTTTNSNGYPKRLAVCDNDDNKETFVDASMVFKEPIKVREQCPSPEPSIKINMNDFEESDSDDEMTSSDVKETFYRNLMAQVNKILQKAEIETRQEVMCNLEGQKLRNKTVNKVKEATLKHLKSIGIDVQNIENSSQSSSSSTELDSKSYDQNEISFAVKQLLMKYLPADHLAKVACKEVQSENSIVQMPNEHSSEQPGVIKNRPEFSFATVQYMKKYNLIANNNKDTSSPKSKQPQSPKILDITMLKKQPKLL